MLRERRELVAVVEAAKVFVFRDGLVGILEDIARDEGKTMAGDEGRILADELQALRAALAAYRTPGERE